MADVDAEQLADSTFDFPEPGEGAKEKQLVLWATHYYVYSAKSVSSGQPLLDKTGNELGPKLSLRDWCLAAIEGTVRVTEAGGNAAVYNYAARGRKNQCDCSPYASSLSAKVKAALGKTQWDVAQGPFGTGVEEMILVPFRSIAVDHRIIPYGAVIYIPQARGVKVTLPSGTVITHDGYFYSADTGGAIKGNHIDVFGGVFTRNPFPGFIKSDASQTFEAFLINDREITGALGVLHHKL